MLIYTRSPASAPNYLPPSSTDFTTHSKFRPKRRPLIIARPRKVVPHSLNRRTKKVLATLVNNPALQIHMILGRILAIRQTDRTRRVVCQPLTNNGIDAWPALADELVLAGGEVVVAGPACDGVRWIGYYM
jgi:hypothetical protein